MAATQTVPGLEVSAPDDDMDLHTDDGFDFGDGDIELDMDPAPSAHDEDLSIHDAASDGGLDLDTAPPDQDDFMADHGDLIEEDIYDDDAGSVVMQALADDDAANEVSMLAPPDEDLIDYSDDEGQQLQKIQSNVSHQEDIEIPDGEADDLSFLSNAPLEDTQDPGFANHSQDESRDNQEPALDDQTSDVHEATAHASVADVQSVGEIESPSHDHHSDREDGGIQLPADENTANVVEDEQSLPKDEAQSAYDDAQGEHQDSQPSELRPVTVNYAGSEFWLFKQHDSEDSGDWLLEDSSAAKSSMSQLFQACRSSLGDDVSNEHELGFCFDHLNNMEVYEDNTACVAVTLERLISMYYTLQTQDGNTEPEPFYVTLQFRPRFATLLSDVAKFADEGRGYSALTSAIAAGETHFSNTLALPSGHDDYHSSDYDDADWNDENEGENPGTEDQEHEEHTAEVKDDEKNAEVHEDEGHTGEIQIGDEHAGEENQDADTSTSELQQAADDHEANNSQSEEVNDEVHEVHGDGQENDTHQSERESRTQEPIESTTTEQVADEELDVNNDQNTTLEQASETNIPQGAVEELPEHHDTPDEPQAHVSPSFDERTPEQILHDKQTEADIVDYSDDEDQEDDETTFVAINEMSESSTTVQGDRPVDGDETGDPASPSHVHDHNDETHDAHDQTDETLNGHDESEGHSAHDHHEVQEEFDFDVEHADGTTLGFDEHVDDEDEQTYHDDAQEYGQDGSFQGFDADATEGDSLERTLEGDSTQDFDGLEYEILDHESHIGMDGEYDGDTVAESVAAGEEEEVGGADELLDLDNAPEWVTDKEPTFELPEEVVLVHDGVDAHGEEDDLGDPSAVAASSAADLTAASSPELTVLSPQGRKRSIDEVGNGLDEATESTDAKRPRV